VKHKYVWLIYYRKIFFTLNVVKEWSQDNSVGIAMGYRLDSQGTGVWFSAGQEIILLTKHPAQLEHTQSLAQ
jgi:hypothetical protein